MRWSDMSQQQIAEWRAIVNGLAARGWQIGDETREFEAGQWRYYQAVLEYENESVALKLMYRAEEARVNLVIRNRAENEVYLHIRYGDSLSSLIELLGISKGDISEKTIKSYLRRLLAICPETYVAVDEDTLVRLTVNGSENVDS